MNYKRKKQPDKEGDNVDKIWWSMHDLKKRTGYSEDWLKENILLHPRYKQMLDIENGGFVYYPERKGERWCFIASKMEEFLQKHFREIFSKKGNTHANQKTIV
jgi:phage pi2 protein 07